MTMGLKGTKRGHKKDSFFLQDSISKRPTLKEFLTLQKMMDRFVNTLSKNFDFFLKEKGG